ncbi:TlpA family protein disulfide reductase [Roseiconus nitratireducens]|uniref:TlpA family protein disulfide reductase n=1 Tax=Roseiconus nitratireducens TaxID=2605748 RepID=A0A5M6D506_9BACT|nr:TlpA disulfide reductase family protein [Roseiconus nitratireducens]KAA5540285.1 TlpA family protein disulfide reductase [Roseiconus nitratireducens]
MHCEHRSVRRAIRLRSKIRSLGLLAGLLLFFGCSPNQSEPDANAQTVAENGSPKNRVAALPPGQQVDSPQSPAAGESDAQGSSTAADDAEELVPPPPGAADDTTAEDGQSKTGFPLADPSQNRVRINDGTAPGQQTLPAKLNDRALRDDLTPAELSQFLQDADRDMQLLSSGKTGIKDEVEIAEMMQAIARKKLEASLMLKKHSDASDTQRVEGIRGQLQALSHLAAMGDLPSANALEALAKENLSAEDPSVVMDSRIVLIGFAIDSLQAGQEGAADEIVSLVSDLTQNPSSDIPAVMIMGQARQMLSRYGQIDQAVAVREKLLSLYGNSSNTLVARIAAEAAGVATFDSTDRLLAAILKNENVALARWTDAVLELIDESPDMSAVQYLAGAALRLEAAGRDKFVDETYSILDEQFTDPDAATTREIQLAQDARQARQKVIGRIFDPEGLPSVEGTDIKMKDYRGKVVLMPFWAVSFPTSLQIIPMLKQIRDQHPEKVAIVGMNLDAEGAPLKEFLAEAEMDFPSYRSVSSATENVANPVALQFGLVSMPFVAVLDQESRVVALDFTGETVQKTVRALLGSNP